MTNTLYDALIAPHAKNDSPFLIADDASVLTYVGFVARAAQIAHVLAEAGVTPGARVVVQAPKLTDTIALYAASLQVGAVYLPLNTAYPEAELQYFIEDAEPKLVVCDSKDEANITAIAQSVKANVLTLSGNAGSLSLAANDKPISFETVDRGPEDLAALLYTSGTTGRS